MLPLDDPRWKRLAHRNWSEGRGAPDVAAELARLLKHPEDTNGFQELWPYLYSEGTLYPAAYAAVPYVLEIARRLPPYQRAEHLMLIGYAAVPEDASLSFLGDVSPLVELDYRQSLKAALPLLSETLLHPLDRDMLRFLLAALAGLKGHFPLQEALENLDCCPEYGEQIVAAEREGGPDNMPPA